VNSMKRPLVPAIGLLSAFIPMAGILISISMSPWFTWTGSFLSDLGRSGVPAEIFNGSLVAGGLLGTLFAYAIMREKFYRSRHGMAAFMLATLSLILVGAFPVQTDTPHTAAAVAFFLLSTASLLLIGTAEKGNSWHGTAFLALGVVSLAALPLYGVPRPWGFNAFVEMLTSAGMSVFTAVTAAIMLKRPMPAHLAGSVG